MSQAGVDRLVVVVKEVGRIGFFLHLRFTCESFHVRTVCVWHCEHAQFCVEFVFMRCIYIYIFIHSFITFITFSFLFLEWFLFLKMDGVGGWGWRFRRRLKNRIDFQINWNSVAVSLFALV